MSKRLLLFFLMLCTSYAALLQRPQAIKNPHGSLKLDCQHCHTTNSWLVDSKQMDFDHSRTGFALVGAHASQNCHNCHESLIFSNIGSACADCHTDIHRGELGKECASCHNAVSWENRQEIFLQHLNTRFPLKGAHALTDCESCHFNQQRNTYKNTPVDCQFCHTEDYLATDNPNHRDAGFPRECQACHRFNAFTWTDTNFDHSFFPLTGAHTAALCADCHTSGYAGTPTDCYFCHQDDYEGSTDPSHQAAQFPLECQTCHNTTVWEQTTYNHDVQYFPIYSGEHRGEWSACSDCHVNASNYKVFECIDCHEHRRSEMDDKHRDVSNYQYSSAACYSCHPRGTE